ncbi:MAG: type II secretion system F family protein [Firmicutes bacterium]|nr:type II secretion system F family protein [Bacillota bacterium]
MSRLEWFALGWWVVAGLAFWVALRERALRRQRQERISRMRGGSAVSRIEPREAEPRTSRVVLTARQRTILSAAVGGGLGALATRLPLGALLGLGLGVGLSTLASRWLAERLRRQRLVALPHFLATLAGGLRAGASLRHVLRLYAESSHTALAPVIADALSREDLGYGLEAIFSDLGEREGIPGLAWLGTALAIQRQTGGSLAQMVDALLEALHNQEALGREVRALTAQGRASMVALTLLIPFIVAVMQLLDPRYLHPLFATTAGHLMLLYAVLSIGLGMWVISRMLRRV